MFDYLRKMKDRQFEKKNQDDEPHIKPKKDKVFIAILVVFALIIIYSVVTGAGNLDGVQEVQKMNYGFKLSIVDGVILGGGVLGYIILRIRKGRK